MTLYGKVLSVTTKNLGEPVTAAAIVGATTLNVADAATFDEIGGIVSVAGEQLTYTAIDADLDTITLATALTTAVADDAFVEVYPPSPVKVAQVDMGDGSDMLPVTVPHALLDKLPDGLRDPGASETVQIDQRGMYEYLVADVSAEEPSTTTLDFTEGEQGVGIAENVTQVDDLQALGQVGASAISADTITFAGQDLDTVLGQSSIGKLLSARLPAQASNIAITTTATKVFELNCGIVPGGRTYRIKTQLLVAGTGTLALTDRIQFRYIYTSDGTTPTEPAGATTTLPVDGGFNDNSVRGGNLVMAAPEGELDLATESPLRIGLVADLFNGAGSYAIYALTAAPSRPTMTLYDDGLLGSRQDAAISLTGGGTSRFVKTFNPTWAYGAQGGNLVTNPGYCDIGNSAAYGYGMFGSFGFNSADIISKLAGVTTPVSLVLRWRPRTRATGTGLDVRFLSHNYSSASAFSTAWFPQQWDDISQPGNMTSQTTASNAVPGTPYDQSLGTTLFSQFRSGTRKSMTISSSATPTSNSHPDGTGTFYSFGTYQPQLIFTYDGTS